MRLTVLGRSGGYPRPGEACAGYLVEGGDARLLLDLGYGVVSRLLARWDPRSVGAVMLSHLHPDHVADFPAFQLALEYAPFPPQRWSARPPVLAPSGAREHLMAFGPEGEGSRIVGDFDFHVLDGVGSLQLVGFTIRWERVRHAVEAYAVRVERDGRSLVYTGDTGECESIERLAQGADVLLAEATFPERLQEAGAAFVHLSGLSAGRLAARAGARRLLLTHFFPCTDPVEEADAAAAEFGGPVEAVVEGATYEI